MIEALWLVLWSFMCVRAGWVIRRRWHRWQLETMLEELRREGHGS